MQTFRYPVDVTKDGEQLLFTVPDIPEAIGCSESLTTLRKDVLDILSIALSYYFEEGTHIPFASKPKKGQVVIDLPLTLVSKIILHNAMLETGTRQADIAKALRIPSSEVARIVNPKRKTKIDTMLQAVLATGKTMELVCA